MKRSLANSEQGSLAKKAFKKPNPATIENILKADLGRIIDMAVAGIIASITNKKDSKDHRYLADMREEREMKKSSKKGKGGDRDKMR